MYTFFLPWFEAGIHSDSNLFSLSWNAQGSREIPRISQHQNKTLLLCFLFLEAHFNEHHRQIVLTQNKETFDVLYCTSCSAAMAGARYSFLFVSINLQSWNIEQIRLWLPKSFVWRRDKELQRTHISLHWFQHIKSHFSSGSPTITGGGEAGNCT